MVGEFPELQGMMGGYYARHDGEAEDVAGAIASQYQNRRKDDGVAARLNLVGEALLIADRVETLVGIWGIGVVTSGDTQGFWPAWPLGFLLISLVVNRIKRRY
jgi:glycyl-tRNA synthetase beta chain